MLAVGFIRTWGDGFITGEDKEYRGSLGNTAWLVPQLLRGLLCFIMFSVLQMFSALLCRILAAGFGGVLLGFFLLNFCFNVMHLGKTIFHFLELIVGKRWNLLTLCYFIMYSFFLHATLWYELLCWALLLWLQGANALLACHRSHSYQKSLALIMLFLLSLLITTICILLDSPGLWSVVWSGSILSCLSRFLVCFAFLLCSALV